jgi:peptidoglycan/xylan/chitin deacetylase (PgdA/CDA1 family)
VRFGAHGLTHHILSQLGAEEAREEIVLSREKVCQELNNPSDVFCYPVGRAGDFSDRDVNVASETGFRAAVSAVPGYVTVASLKTRPFSLPRFTFPDNKADFMQYCSWVEYLKGRFVK